MWFFNQRINLTHQQKRSIFGIVLILALTSSRVQAAEIDIREARAATIPAPVTTVEPETRDTTAVTTLPTSIPVDPTPSSAPEATPPSTVVLVPPAPATTELALPKKPTAPRRVWNKVNAPDLDTTADRSTESALRTIVVSATAYTSDPRETDSTPFTTANGTRVRDGIAAANFLKFGTRFRIPDYFGDKVFEVHDRMNPRYNRRIDIWMLKKADARAWGVRTVKIEILP